MRKVKLVAMLSGLLLTPVLGAQDTTLVREHVPAKVIVAMLVSRSDVMLDSARIRGCSLKPFLGPAYADSLGDRLKKLVIEASDETRCGSVDAPGGLATVSIESIHLVTDTTGKARFAKRDSIFIIAESTAKRNADTLERYVIARAGFVSMPFTRGWSVIEYRLIGETISD
jgi:hypothetical protein